MKEKKDDVHVDGFCRDASMWFKMKAHRHMETNEKDDSMTYTPRKLDKMNGPEEGRRSRRHTG
jgi:hypothetical protein